MYNRHWFVFCRFVLIGRTKTSPVLVSLISESSIAGRRTMTVYSYKYTWWKLSREQFRYASTRFFRYHNQLRARTVRAVMDTGIIPYRKCCNTVSVRHTDTAKNGGRYRHYTDTAIRHSGICHPNTKGCCRIPGMGINIYQ